MKIIKIFPLVGSFAENKDVARNIRISQIEPLLDESSAGIVLDFEEVESTTQSFVHALISDVIRNRGSRVLDKLLFKNCNDKVKGIVNIVVDYMQS